MISRSFHGIPVRTAQDQAELEKKNKMKI